MRRFTDNAGRAWTIHLDYAAISRVRDLLGLDLLDFERVAAIEHDAALLVDVLFVCSRGHELSDRRFGRAMRGETIYQAREALFTEWLAFFPEPDDSKPPAKGPRIDAAGIDRMVWQCAGTIGVHPGPYTLRQLLVMCEAKPRADWRRTSSLMWLLANIHRKPGSAVKPLSMFDPYAPKEQPRTVSFDLFFADMMPQKSPPTMN